MISFMPSRGALAAVVVAVVVSAGGSARAYPSWAFVDDTDGNPATGLNQSSAAEAFKPAMAVFNGALYVAFIEGPSPAPATDPRQLRVRKLDGATWSFVDGGGSTGLNRDTATSADDPALVVFNDRLYLAWAEEYFGYATGATTAANQIHVMSYDGVAWAAADGNLVTGLNRNTTGSSARGPSLATWNGSLYLAFDEYVNSVEQIRVRRHDGGGAWTFVDNVDDTDVYTGLNVAKDQKAFDAKLAVWGNELYAIWTEYNVGATSVLQLRARRFDGVDAWTFVDGGAATGLNLNTTEHAQMPSVTVVAGGLFVTWYENIGWNPRIHVRQYGEAGFGSIDGLGVTSPGLNRDPVNCLAYHPVALGYNNAVYLSWLEEDCSDTTYFWMQVRAARFDGATRVFIDGDAATGLNYNTDVHAADPNTFQKQSTSAAVVFGGELYLAWHEGQSGIEQLRVKKTSLPPTVSTGSASSVTASTASLDGTIDFTGGASVTRRGVEYKKSSDPDTSYVASYEDIGGGPGTGSYARAVSGLTASTSYTFRAYATNSIGTHRGDPATFTTAAPSADIAATPALNEATLDASTLTVTLNGTTLVDTTLDAANFTLLDPPPGLTLEGVTYTDATHCTVSLAFDGPDFDTSPATGLGLVIAAVEIATGAPMVAANRLPVTAVNDAESIAITDDGQILEGQESDEVITVTLAGGTFAASLDASHWTVGNLPAGVTKGAVTRVSATQATVTLSGNTTVDYDADITDITVACTAAEYADATGGGALQASSGVTLLAKTTPTVVTGGASAITPFAATLPGEVTFDGRLAVTARGFEHKRSSESTYVTASAGSGTGTFDVGLTGLVPSTSYDFRAYASNAEGTSYGVDASFTTAALEATVAADQPMQEGDLGGRTINVTITGTTFATTSLLPVDFSLLQAPAGLSIGGVVCGDPTHCALDLDFDGTDLDADVTQLGVTIAAAALSTGEAMTAKNRLTIAAVNDAETLTVADDGQILEGEENGEVLTVTLAGGTFAPSLSGAAWTVANLPAGVVKGAVARVSATQATITLSGNTTIDYDADITGVTVTGATTEYADATGGDALQATGITLLARTAPSVTTGAASMVAPTSVTLAGEVTSTGRLPVTARGVEYKRNADVAYSAVSAGTGPGAFSVDLTGLTVGTAYDFRAYATNAEGTTRGLAGTFTTPLYTATIAADQAMSEIDLGARTITVTLLGTTFATTSLLAADFALGQAPAGLGIGNVVYIDPAQCALDLAFDGTDFDIDHTHLDVTIAAAALSSGQALTSTNELTVTAVDDPESITIAGDGQILEGSEDGEVITVTIAGGTFAPTLSAGGFAVANLPAGVAEGDVARLSATQATITLAGNATVDYDADITDVTVSCGATQYADAAGGGALQASGVTLLARTVPSVSTGTATAVTAVSATLAGEVTTDGRLAVTGRGVEYKPSSGGSYQAVAAGAGSGAFTASVAGLTPGVSYDYRAYATNGEGTVYGQPLTFTTVTVTATIAPDQAVTEVNLAERSIVVTLTGTTFTTFSVLSAFTLTGAPAGLSVAAVQDVDPTHRALRLAFDLTDFDADVTHLGLTIDEGALATGLPLTATNDLSITALDDAETLTVHDDGQIVEGSEDGEVLTVTLAGGTFAPALTLANWSVASLPAGVTLGAVTRVGPTVATLTLAGSSQVDYDVDLTGVTVSCAAAEYADATGSGALVTSGGVTLRARTAPVVSTGTTSALTPTTVTLSGEVVTDGRLPVTARGCQYRASSAGTYHDAPASAGVGVFSVDLTGLTPSTAYEFRAYATNAEGTSHGATATFTTPAAPLVPSATLSAVGTLAEDTLDSGQLLVSLTGTSFVPDPLASDLTLVGGPAGLSVGSVACADATSCLLTLAFDGTDFDADIGGLGVTIAGAALTSGATLSSTGGLVIAAADDTEALSVVSDGSILEGGESGEALTVTLTGGTFAPTLTPAGWTVSSLPAGVSLGSAVRAGARTVLLTLTGNATADYDADITSVTVTCAATEYRDAAGGGPLSTTGGIVLLARTMPVLGALGVTGVSTTGATLAASVTADGRAAVTARGFEYRRRGDAAFTAVTTALDGASFTAVLTGLTPGTEYETRAWATNVEGTTYGAVTLFTTATAPDGGDDNGGCSALSAGGGRAAGVWLPIVLLLAALLRRLSLRRWARR